LQKLNQNYFLLCGPYSGESEKKDKFRIPSISLNDWMTEWTESKKNNSSFNILMFLSIPFVLSFGLIFDIFLKKILNNVSSSKWSWCFLALPFGIFVSLIKKPKKILATGGPTAAHLTAVILGKILGIKVVCEFQDPIISTLTNTKSLKFSIAKKIESFIISNSQKSVFVTRAACKSAKIRNKTLSKKISYIYPNSWNFISRFHQISKLKHENIKILHLGTLYGNRNIDVLIDIVSEINKNKKKKMFEVINMGSIYLAQKLQYLKNDFFVNLNEQYREDAIKFALKCDMLLLAQHQNELGVDTIPYKFYDYLNCNKPILALRKNSEIDNFLNFKKDLAARNDEKEKIMNFLLNFNPNVIYKNNYNKNNEKFLESVKQLIK